MFTTWSRVLLALLLLLAVAVVGAATPPLREPVMPVVMERGALITAVTPGGPADRAGLEVGDIIVAVNGMMITSESDLHAALRLDAVARIEVVKRDTWERFCVLALVEEGELGARVLMVGPDTAPFLPRYRCSM